MALNVQEIIKAEPEAQVKRFDKLSTIEHWILLVTFTMLVVTGLPQKFAQVAFSQTLIALMGGIETVRVIHRIMAGGMMVSAIMHGGSLTYRLFVLRRPAYLLPTFRDMRDAIQHITYSIGLTKEHPHMPRFNFEEKLEYWAVVWGTVVMVVTGFMLWNPVATTRFLPGEFVPAAKAAHGGEALLAAISIVLFHMYSVLSNRNFSIFTGKMRLSLYQTKHAEELEDILDGDIPTMPDEDVWKKRMRLFVPWAVIMTIALVAALIWFVTFEQTAITTLPQ